MEEFPEVTAIWGPNPSCERGYAFALNSTVDGTKIGYGSEKNVVVRDSFELTECSVASVHRAPVKVVKFAYKEGEQQLVSADEAGQLTMFKMKGRVLDKEKQMLGIGGRTFDIAWYASDKGLACVGDAKGTNGRVFTTSGTDQGNISGSKRLTSVDIYFYDDNKRNLKDAQLATAGDDLKVKFYSYAGGFSLRGDCTNIKFKVGVNMVRYSPDGKYLVAVGNKEMIIMDCENEYKKLAVAGGDKKKGEHTGNIYSVSWNSDSNAFLTTSSDKSVKCWGFDGSTLTLKDTLSFKDAAQFGPAVSDFQLGCCYVGDGSVDRWASVSLCGDIHIVVFKGGKLEVEAKVVAPTGPITGMDVNQDDGSIAVSTAKGEVLLYDKSGAAQRFKGLKNAKKCIAVAHMGDALFSTGWDDVLSNTNVENMKVSNRKLNLGGQPLSMRRAALSKDLLVIAKKTEVIIVDKTKPNAALAKLAGGAVEITSAGLNQKGDTLAVGFANKEIRLFKVESGNIVDAGVKTEAQTATSRVIAFSNDGEHFAVGFKTKHVRLFNLNGEEVASWGKHTAMINDLDFSPDGRWLLSGGGEGDIGIWDLSKLTAFKPKKYFKKAHLTGVSQAKWLDDSTFYTAGLFDGSIKRWNVTL